MKLSAQWIREFVDLGVDDRRLGDDLTAAGIAVEGISGSGADCVFEMEIGTNRPDAMNHYGVAREAAAIYDLPLKQLSAVSFQPSAKASNTPFPITVEEPSLCPRFSARVIRGTQIKPSPEKIAHRLQLLDQRPISNAVDATNYVLWEMGKPTHVFDMDLLEGGRLIIRHARDGEKFKTLDGVERTLTSEDLVVADARKPVGLAGVMGGFDTMITEKTRNILIESAWWDPGIVRRMSRRHGMHTDASHRFERGADFESTVLSCDLVAALILETGGGELVGDAVDVVSRKMDQAPIVLRVSEVRRILGGDIEVNEIFRILKKLGFVLIPEGQADAQFRVQIPSWRLDVEREIDLVEEIARLHGYDKFENTLPTYSGAVVELPHAAADAAFRSRALALGYDEALSLTFISHADAERFFASETSAAKAASQSGGVTARLEAVPFYGSAGQSSSGQGSSGQGSSGQRSAGQGAAGHSSAGQGSAGQRSAGEGSGPQGSARQSSVLPTSIAGGLGSPESSSTRVLELENPLSEEASVMRTSMAPGMLDMLAWNLNRDVEEARLFEMGRVYEMRGGERVEPARACLGATLAAVMKWLPAGAVLEVSKGQKSSKPKDGSSGARSAEFERQEFSASGSAEIMEAFRSFKGDVENLLAGFDCGELTFDRGTAEYFHPGRSARALANGAVVAQFGLVADEVKAQRKLRQEVFLAEIDLERLREFGLRPVLFAPLGKYPAVERDFSFVFSDEVEFEAMRRAVVGLRIAELRGFRPVEIFRGGSVGAGKYSILLRAKLQSDSATLREEQIAGWAAEMVTALGGLGGVQRA